jgi:hypothetical protein
MGGPASGGGNRLCSCKAERLLTAAKVKMAKLWS